MNSANSKNYTTDMSKNSLHITLISCKIRLQVLEFGYHINVVGFIHQNVNLYTCLALCIFVLIRLETFLLFFVAYTISNMTDMLPLEY